LGHIGTSVGASEVEIEVEAVEAEGLVDRVRRLSTETDPGFTQYNTLLMVDEGETFVPAGTRRIIRSGQSVVLIPFSHGG